MDITRGELEMDTVESLQQSLRHPLDLFGTLGERELKLVEELGQDHLWVEECG